MVVILAMGWHRQLSFETLVRHRAGIDAFVAEHYTAAIAAFVALYVAVAALSVPGAAVLTICGGILFGWLAGGRAAIAGGTTGAIATFVGATALGIVPGTFAYALVGEGLDSVIRAEGAAFRACLAAGRSDCRLHFDMAAALTPQLLAALAALGLIALIPILLRRWRARNSANS